MKSLALASLVAALLPACAGAADVASTEGASYRCTIDSARNASMGSAHPISEPEREFPLSALTRQGDSFVLHETRTTELTDATIDHAIDPASGAYSAVKMLTDHAIGEQHEIRLAGQCELTS